MIILKSPEEIDRMRVAGRITALTVQRLVEEVRPGMTTADLDALRSEAHRRDMTVAQLLRETTLRDVRAAAS